MITPPKIIVARHPKEWQADFFEDFDKIGHKTDRLAHIDGITGKNEAVDVLFRLEKFFEIVKLPRRRVQIRENKNLHQVSYEITNLKQNYIYYE